MSNKIAAVRKTTAPAPPAQIIRGAGFLARITGSKLTIEIDLSQDLGPSESGRSTIIARSERFQELTSPGEWLNLMVCRKVAKK